MPAFVGLRRLCWRVDEELFRDMGKELIEKRDRERKLSLLPDVSTRMQKWDHGVVESWSNGDGLPSGRGFNPTGNARSLRMRHALVSREHFAYRRGKIIHPRAWHDNRVTPAMRLFGDAQKLSTIILTELDVELLALDLQPLRLDNVVHFELRFF